MSEKFKKTINRAIIFILSLPFAIPILSPILLLYALYLSTFPEGRAKLRRYYAFNLDIIVKLKTSKGRSEIWKMCKDYWYGKN